MCPWRPPRPELHTRMAPLRGRCGIMSRMTEVSSLTGGARGNTALADPNFDARWVSSRPRTRAPRCVSTVRSVDVAHPEGWADLAVNRSCLQAARSSWTRPRCRRHPGRAAGERAPLAAARARAIGLVDRRPRGAAGRGAGSLRSSPGTPAGARAAGGRTVEAPVRRRRSPRRLRRPRIDSARGAARQRSELAMWRRIRRPFAEMNDLRGN